MRSGMIVEVTPASYDVRIWLLATLNAEEVVERTWKESIPR